MLRVVKLSCERGDHLLFSDLSIKLTPGELLKIEGANGAGKTTLLRILAGLSSDYRGNIFWKDKNISSNIDFQLSTFYCGHKPAVKTELTPVENIVWRVNLRNKSCSKKKIFKALEELNLDGREDMLCGELSAGQNRRVVLADLLITSSNLWILDEPFTAIDIYGKAWLEQILVRHIQHGGMVIISSHQKLSKTSQMIRLEDYANFDEDYANFDTDMDLNKILGTVL